MIQRVSYLSLCLIAAFPAVAFAQAEETFTVEEADTPAEPPPETPTEPTPDTASDPFADEEEDTKGAKGLAKLGETRVSWKDIIVVKHKPFLKMNRLELMPTWGITLNDNMITHYAFNGQVNYYLTDVLAVGAEAMLFTHTFRETYDLVARQDRRLPTLNQYNYAGSLNFHYAPIYAKFAVFNRTIVHLEMLATIGVGVTQTEVIPRDPALKSWTNLLITPNVGITTHVFLTRWITLNLAVRDYIFLDKYESVSRTAADDLDTAKANADSKLVNHIMFQAGLSLWFPTSFRYTTFR